MDLEFGWQSPLDPLKSIRAAKETVFCAFRSYMTVRKVLLIIVNVAGMARAIKRFSA